MPRSQGPHCRRCSVENTTLFRPEHRHRDENPIRLARHNQKACTTRQQREPTQEQWGGLSISTACVLKRAVGRFRVHP